MAQSKRSAARRRQSGEKYPKFMPSAARKKNFQSVGSQKKCIFVAEFLRRNGKRNFRLPGVMAGKYKNNLYGQ
jgi:hypothetical protein